MSYAVEMARMILKSLDSGDVHHVSLQPAEMRILCEAVLLCQEVLSDEEALAMDKKSV